MRAPASALDFVRAPGIAGSWRIQVDVDVAAVEKIAGFARVEAVRIADIRIDVHDNRNRTYSFTLGAWASFWGEFKQSPYRRALHLTIEYAGGARLGWTTVEPEGVDAIMAADVRSRHAFMNAEAAKVQRAAALERQAVAGANLAAARAQLEAAETAKAKADAEVSG